MAIRNWHSGTLVVLWIIGLALELALLRWRSSGVPATAGTGGGAGEHAVRSAVGWAIIPILEIAILVALLVIVWLWVRGRHQAARRG